jgi:hypothetical protein
MVLVLSPCITFLTAFVGCLVYFYATFGCTYVDYSWEISFFATGTLLITSFLVSKICKNPKNFPSLLFKYTRCYLLWTGIFLVALSILRLTPYWLFFPAIAFVHRTPAVLFATVSFLATLGLLLLYLLVASTKKTLEVSTAKAAFVTLLCLGVSAVTVGAPVILLTNPSVTRWIGADEDVLYSLVGADFGHLVLDFRKNWSKTYDKVFQGPTGASFPRFDYERKNPSLTYVIDVRELTPDLKVCLQTLQGVVNKDGPKLYLISRTFDDNVWLETIPGPKKFIDWKESFQVFREYLRGKVIFQNGSIHERCVAVTIAGLENAVAVPDNLDLDGLVEPDLPIFENLVGKGKNPIALYEWAIEKFWPRCNKRILGIQPLHAHEVAFVDFVVRNEAFLSSLNFVKSPIYFYYREKEAKLFEHLLENMPPNSMIIGEPVMPGGTGEFETVAALAKYGHSLFTALGASNLSFTSWLPMPELKQRVEPENVQLENKVYVTFIVTDGDHLGQVKEWLPRLYLDSARGQIPLGWTLNPILVDLAPNVIEWYYRNAVNDIFICGPNGVGYTYASINPYFLDFLEHSRGYVERADMRYVLLLDHMMLGASPNTLKQYAKVFRGIFNEYGLTWKEYKKSFELANKVPVIYSASFLVSKEYTLEHLRKKTPHVRPAFLFVALFPWRANPSDVQWIAKNIGEDYVIVRPDTFLRLLSEASGSSSFGVITK